MKVLVINGPNINLLGLREPHIYGHTTYHTLIKMIEEKARALGITVTCFQSNNEGDIVDVIQAARYPRAVVSSNPSITSIGIKAPFDAIIINPAAYTHTSVAILDALQGVQLPTVEVHISNPRQRESFRHTSYVGLYAEKTILGQGLEGYLHALEYIANTYQPTT
ncbi:type II 3-dehydroquinate dehydratase [Veillonella montpellierensis]|uniref:type II 3-dehydroquinate dehydratase n=1 Tax=Veillonella montpellierensis TaxID=187328 RepID=UPI0023F8B561|nr:type II 3-dehydroquinate dehydratase [Veillonella montpellierensis]